jgi:hypothetical protein
VVERIMAYRQRIVRGAISKEPDPVSEKDAEKDADKAGEKEG